MDVCPDYEDLFKTLNAHHIKYLVVGALAMIHYTEPRYTKDMDVWIIPEMNDPKKIFAALSDFGAPLKGMEPEEFKNKNMILQIGVELVRIDILMNIAGVNFKTVWQRRKTTQYGGATISILGIEDLIRAKKKAGRGRDHLDLEKLYAVKTRS